MTAKKEIDVLINQKKYTIYAYESEDYVQRLATYLNNKYQELKNQEGYYKMDSELRGIFLEINLADDYFKLKKALEEQQVSEEQKNTELYRITHDLMEAQNHIKQLKSDLEAAKQKQIDYEKKIVKLETELSQHGNKKNNK